MAVGADQLLVLKFALQNFHALWNSQILVPNYFFNMIILSKFSLTHIIYDIIYFGVFWCILFKFNSKIENKSNAT